MFKKINSKIFLFSLVMLMLGALLVFNVLLLDIKGVHLISGLDIMDVSNRTVVKTTLTAERGRIYDVNGTILAQDTTVYDISIRLKQRADASDTDYVTDVAGTARILSEILDTEYDDLLYYMSRDVAETEIGSAGRGLTKEVKQQIQNAAIPGVSFVARSQRYYPYNNFSSHLVGFASYSRDEGKIIGSIGIENILNDYLTGTDGYHEYVKDSSGTPMIGGEIENVPAVDGNDVYLTLNSTIQTALQTCLQNTMDMSGVKVNKAWGMVMNAKTGAILGYDSYPTFNQNTREGDIDYNDYVSTLPYEPGSVIKPFIYATAFDIGALKDIYSEVNCNNFGVGIDSNGKLIRVATNKAIAVIHNNANKQWGMTTFARAFVSSYNTATAELLASYVPLETYKTYMENFGFWKYVDTYGITEGSTCGSENLTNVLDAVATTYGQGSSFTCLQMMQAYSAICNDGIMIKPYIIDKIVNHDDGKIVYQGETEVVGQPISASSAKKVRELMELMVNSGWNKRGTLYAVDGVKVGGKTGTAQVAINGRYDDKITLHTIVLAMPIDDPQAIIYVSYEDNYPSSATNQLIVHNLEKTVASVMNLYEHNSNQENTKIENEVYYDAMPNLVNHSLGFAKEKLGQFKNLKPIIIGQGDSVIKQYPSADSTITSGQNVMLLTSTGIIDMPDMTGWSRKDVIAFWQLTGIAVQLEGDGFVYEQSIEKGAAITKGNEIIVRLK